jgi:hypothetical protein
VLPDALASRTGQHADPLGILGQLHHRGGARLDAVDQDPADPVGHLQGIPDRLGDLEEGVVAADDRPVRDQPEAVQQGYRRAQQLRHAAAGVIRW